MRGDEAGYGARRRAERAVATTGTGDKVGLACIWAGWLGGAGEGNHVQRWGAERAKATTGPAITGMGLVRASANQAGRLGGFGRP